MLHHSENNKTHALSLKEQNRKMKLQKRLLENTLTLLFKTLLSVTYPRTKFS